MKSSSDISKNCVTMEDKKIKDLTDDELDDFTWDIKWKRFDAWADKIGEIKGYGPLNEMSKKLGYPSHSPFVLMAAAFFDGVDAGIDLCQAIEQHNI